MSSDDTYAGLLPCPEIEPIEGKDRIGVVTLSGNKVIVRKDGFNKGDLGLYVYVDSVLPVEMVEHYQLERLKNGRVKAMKMSGIVSQGLFLPRTYEKIPQDAKMYDNIAEQLEIKHWKPDVKIYKGTTPHINSRNWPQWLEVMHITRLNRPDYLDKFTEQDEVIVTEKIHGMNSTFAFTRPYKDELLGKEFEETFSVMSRKVNFKRERLGLINENIDFQTNAFYSVADKLDLENKLKQYSDQHNCDIIIRGEIFGKGVQDLTYGLDGIEFRVFDIQTTKGEYLDWYKMKQVAYDLGLPTVPIVYQGPYNYETIEKVAANKSTICPSQISEGVVVRPLTEQKIGNTGERRILKLLNPAYLTRDDSKEVAE